MLAVFIDSVAVSVDETSSVVASVTSSVTAEPPLVVDSVVPDAAPHPVRRSDVISISDAVVKLFFLISYYPLFNLSDASLARGLLVHSDSSKLQISQSFEPFIRSSANIRPLFLESSLTLSI